MHLAISRHKTINSWAHNKYDLNINKKNFSSKMTIARRTSNNTTFYSTNQPKSISPNASCTNGSKQKLPGPLGTKRNSVRSRNQTPVAKTTSPSRPEVATISSKTWTSWSSQCSKCRRNDLSCFLQNLDEIPSKLSICMSEKCKGSSPSSCTASSANPVDIILQTWWKIIIDHTFYVFHICNQ